MDQARQERARFRGVIFDLDGTLVDSLDDIADSANQVLREMGCPMYPVDAYRYFVGDGVGMLVHRILPEERRTRDEEESCARRYREIYADRWNVKTAPYPGVVPMLDALAAAGLRLAVLSNKPHDATEECVRGFLGTVHFDAVQGQTAALPKKPDPAGALAIAALLGLKPDEILYVGDTATDMQTAVRAGMYPAGVLWGFRPAEELTANGAARLVSHPSELIPIATGRNGA